MKRVVSIEQRKGMHAVLPERPKGEKRPDCAFCRHAKTVIDNGRFVFACKREHPIMIAESCPDFRDSRVGLSASYLRGIVAGE